MAVGSPGGVEEGRVSIRVVPDTSKFAADLRADLRRIREELRVDIPVHLDTSGLIREAREATAEANAAAGRVEIKTDIDRSSLSQVALTLRRFGTGIGSFLTSTLKGATFAGLGLSAAAAVPHLLALTGALAPLVGLIGLIPAALSGAVVTFGALAIGLQGFGQALKDVGDTKKFQQDLKNLSPAAADAAKAVKSLVPEFKGLRKVVQQHLFAGLATDIKTTVHAVLPSLRSGLAEVADSLNLVFHNAGIALSQLAKSGVLHTLFHGIAQSLTLIAPAIADFLDAFVRIAAIGSGPMLRIAGAIQEAATAFDNFVSTPAGAQAVEDFINNAISAFGLLFDVVKSTTEIFGGLISAAQAAGGGTLQTFAATLQSVADVVNSPAFQTGLTQVFAGLLEGASALAGALPAIGGALAAIAPLIGALAGALGTTLAAAINAVAPALTILLQALVPELVSGLGTVVPLIVQGLGALAPILADIATTLAANKPLLIAVAIGIGALVAPVTTLIAAALLLAANWQTVTTFFQQNVVPVFQQVVQFLQPVIIAFGGVAQSVQQMFAVIAPIFAQIFAIVASNWPQIQEIIVQALLTVRAVVVAVLTNIALIISAVTATIKGVWQIFGNTILSTIRTVFPAILQIIRGVLQIIEGVASAFTAVVRGDWSGLFNSLVTIARGALNLVVGAFKLLGGLLQGAIQGMADIFLSIGRGIMEGIAKGVKSSVGSLKDAITGNIKGALGHAASFLGINSPSKLFAEQIGGPIAEGIAKGIADGSGLVSGAVQSAVTPGIHSDLSGAGSGGLASVSRLPGVTIESVTVKDVEELAEVISAEQRDAAVVEGLQSLLIGA